MANNRDGARSPSYADALKSPPSRPAPINTALAQGGYGGGWNTGATAATANTASSSRGSFGDGSAGSGVTPATSLYAPSIWSPGPQETQSATMPKKLSWEQALNQVGQGKAVTGKQQRLPSPLIATPQSAVPPMGLGLQFGDFSASDNKSGSKFTPWTGRRVESNTGPPSHMSPRSPYQFQQRDIKDAQTSPFMNLAADANVNTYPLMQYPFGSGRQAANQPRAVPTGFQVPEAARSPIGTAAIKTPLPGLGTEYSPNNQGSIMKTPGASADYTKENTSTQSKSGTSSSEAQRADSLISASDQSFCSDITVSNGEGQGLTSAESPVIEQESHPFSFVAKTHDFSAYVDEAFPGASVSLKSLNPSHFPLPHGSRVICIKTDFVENIQWAIEKGQWAAMDKVGNRIMRVWDERQSEDDKVFFLFSINGHKSYCAVAEMAGPFAEGSGNLEDWVKGDDGSVSWGTMPVTWCFVKNVSYGWFSDILHSHNGQPIVNMWNGMHFPMGVGRKVLELYIKRPHFTNVMAWIPDEHYRPGRKIEYAGQIDPDLLGKARGNGRGRGRGRGETRMIGNARALKKDRENVLPLSNETGGVNKRAAMTNDWRQPIQQQTGKVVGEVNNNAPTRTTQARTGATTPTVSVTPPTFDGAASPTPRPGQMIQCIIDEHGNYVPINQDPRSAGHSNNGGHAIRPTGQQIRGAPSPQAASFGFPRGRGNFRGGRAGFRGRFHSPTMSRSFDALNAAYMQSPNYMQTPTSPAVRRIRSQGGMDDPFASPGHANPANPMNNMPSQNNGGQHPVYNYGAANANVLQRAAPAANFVPQSFASNPASSASSVCNGNGGYGVSLNTSPYRAGTSAGRNHTLGQNIASIPAGLAQPQNVPTAAPSQSQSTFSDDEDGGVRLSAGMNVPTAVPPQSQSIFSDDEDGGVRLSADMNVPTAVPSQSQSTFSDDEDGGVRLSAGMNVPTAVPPQSQSTFSDDEDGGVRLSAASNNLYDIDAQSDNPIPTVYNMSRQLDAEPTAEDLAARRRYLYNLRHQLQVEGELAKMDLEAHKRKASSKPKGSENGGTNGSASNSDLAPSVSAEVLERKHIAATEKIREWEERMEDGGVPLE